MRQGLGFLSRVNHLAALSQPEHCWLWTGAKDAQGYGITRFQGLCARAHRAAWIAFRGPIPPSQYVCHSCDTPACVNPAHLWLGSALDNMRDKHAKGRQRYPGPKQPARKLSQANTADILTDTRSLRAIAKDYGVSHVAILKIKQRGQRSSTLSFLAVRNPGTLQPRSVDGSFDGNRSKR